MTNDVLHDGWHWMWIWMTGDGLDDGGRFG